METIILKVKAVINSKEVEAEVTNPTSKEEIQTALIEQFEQDNDDNEEIINNILPDIDPDSIEFEVTDWDEAEQYNNLKDIDTICEICDNNPDSNWEIISAAVECNISIDDIDEAYSGEFKDDEDFAKNMAEELGEIDKNAHWPHTCIDWEQAARELMHDYCEANGHYFRIY